MRSSVAASCAKAIVAKRLDLQSYFVLDVTQATIVAACHSNSVVDNIGK